MATSGSIVSSPSGVLLGAKHYTLSWTRTGYSIANNTSTISWEFTIETNMGDGGYGSNTYTININGSTYSGSLPARLEKGVNVIRSGSFTVTHAANGSKSFAYNFSCGRSSNSKVVSASGTAVLDTLPRPATLTSAVDFTDDENPTITYNNISGNSVGALEACISFTGVTDDIKYRAVSKTGNTYTFVLTDAERATLRSNIPLTSDNTTVRFYLKTVIEGVNYYSILVKTLTYVDYTPTLAPTVSDVNTKTVALTGDNQTFIRYYSNAAFNTGATARKGATLSHQTITCGSTALDDYTSNTGTIEGVDSNTFYFSATDSRGYTTRDFLVKELIPYVKLTVNIKQTVLTFNGDLTFIIGGKYFDGSFGAKNNSLEVEYSLQDEDGNYVTNPDGSGWQPLGVVTPTVDENGNYTYEYTVSGLEHEATYTLSVNVIDELTPVMTATTVIAVTPIFDWGKSDFHFNVPVYLKDAETPLTAPADYVTEQGVSGTWFYRKWNSGRVELYGYQNVDSVACNTALGNMYRSAAITPPFFPFTINSPKVVATYESEGYGAFLWPTTLTTTAKPMNYYLVRPTSSASITGKVNFHVQGSL